MYGKLAYDTNENVLICEFPVRGKSGMLMCGRRCKNLSRHITVHHKISTKEYKRMMGLDLNLPLVTKDLQEKWRKANKDLKLYLNLEKGKPYRLKKGKTTIQNYKRSEQTKARLRNLKRNVDKKSKK